MGGSCLTVCGRFFSLSACSQKSSCEVSLLITRGSQIPHTGFPRAQFEDPFGQTEVSEEPLMYPEVASGSDGADSAWRCVALKSHQCLQSDEQGSVHDVTEQGSA